MLKNRSFALISFVFALLCVSSFNTVNAQIRYGIKGGVDIVDHKINTDMLNTRNRLGFQVGGTLEFGLPIVGGLETSLLYGHKEYKAEFKEEDSSISDYNYLTLPVNLKKRWGLTKYFGIYVHGGPYATLKLNGGDIKTLTEDIKSKHLGMGLNFGAGVKLFKQVDLGLQYRVDLTDKYSDSKADIGNFADKKQQSWSLGLTYFFN